jgi:hypothetical protein
MEKSYKEVFHNSLLIKLHDWKDTVKENEMGRACGMCESKEKCTQVSGAQT